MSEHTPGPWEWRGNQLYAPSAGSTLLRDVTFWNQDPGDKSLIAAAPKLLEACASVWAALADTDDPNLRQVADECRAAIAKATSA